MRNGNALCLWCTQQRKLDKWSSTFVSSIFHHLLFHSVLSIWKTCKKRPSYYRHLLRHVVHASPLKFQFQTEILPSLSLIPLTLYAFFLISFFEASFSRRYPPDLTEAPPVGHQKTASPPCLTSHTAPVQSQREQNFARRVTKHGVGGHRRARGERRDGTKEEHGDEHWLASQQTKRNEEKKRGTEEEEKKGAEIDHHTME